MQQIRIYRERRIAALVGGDGNLMLFGEGDQICARLELPLAPRGNDLDVGVQGIGRKLESHLVIALARRPMRNRIRTRLCRNFNKPLGNQRPCN